MEITLQFGGTGWQVSRSIRLLSNLESEINNFFENQKYCVRFRYGVHRFDGTEFRALARIIQQEM